MKTQRNVKKKGLSILLSAVLALTSLSFSGLGTLAVDADGESTAENPSVTAFATSKQLMNGNIFGLYSEESEEESTEEASTPIAQKVYFGSTDGTTDGTKLQWYIAGKDTAQTKDNMVLFSAQSLGNSAFDASNQSNQYSGSTLEATLKSLEYGAGANTNAKFSSAEDELMLETTFGTLIYGTEDSISSTGKLYALNAKDNADTFVRAGANDDIFISNAYWTTGFWLRASQGQNTMGIYARLAYPTGGNIGCDGVNSTTWAVIPAFDLDLSEVLFGSTAPAATEATEEVSSLENAEAMTLRLDGSEKIQSTIVWDGTFINVKNLDSDTEVYLCIQGKDETGDWVSTQKVKSQNWQREDLINGESVDLSKCKIWLEMKDTTTGLVYAKMADRIINNVAVTGVDTPTAGQALDTDAVCTTEGVLTTNPTVTYTESGNTVSGTANYFKEYTATVTLQADVENGYQFSTSLESVTINGQSVDYVHDPNEETLTICYTFPKIAKKDLSNAYYVTTEDLMGCFDLDGEDDTVGEIYLGTTEVTIYNDTSSDDINKDPFLGEMVPGLDTGSFDNGYDNDSDNSSESSSYTVITPMRWYIAGKDGIQRKDNVVLFAAQGVGTSQFNEDDESNQYSGTNQYSGSMMATTLASYEYGDGSNEDAKFTAAEDTLMLNTTVSTKIYQSDEKTYDTSKLYVLSGTQENTYITAGADDSIQINTVYWNAIDLFDLRVPYDNDEPKYILVAGSLFGSKVSVAHITNTVPIIPAFDLDLTNVLFASAAPAATEINAGTDGNEDAEDTTVTTASAINDAGFAMDDTTPIYTLRMKDTENRIASTASYDADSVYVTKEGGGVLYLYVQDEDSVYAKQITEDTNVTLAEMDGISDLTAETTRIWLETTDDSLTYAKEATPKMKLLSITAPDAITDVAHGTEKTAEALGLPTTVTLVIEEDGASEETTATTSVDWDLRDVNYDPALIEMQTFTVPGTVTLPGSIIQNGVELTTEISVTVNALVDTIAPTVTITACSNQWNTFWNTVTFGLFCKNTQNVTITATDDESGIDTVEYFLSDTAYNSVDAITEAGISWETYNEPITLAKNSKQIVYAKATDRKGNVTIVNSNGIVIYTDAAQITKELTYTKEETNGDLTAEVALNGNTINAITEGENVLRADTDYTVTADGKITLKQTYLDGLDAGVYTLTISYNPLGETYSSTTENEAPATTDIILTVLAHEHTYATDWSSDNTGHWYAATCAHTTEQDSYAVHTWNDGEVTTEATAEAEGVKTYTCTICGKTKTESIDKLEAPTNPEPTDPDVTDPSEGEDPSNPGTTDPTNSDITDPSNPGEGEEPSNPDEGDNMDEPYIKGEDGTTGWEAIQGELQEKISEADNQPSTSAAPAMVTVEMNGATEVPDTVFEQIKGKNVTVTFDLGNSITWKVNGKDVTADELKTIDLGVIMDSGRISEDKLLQVAGNRTTRQLSLAYDGPFGFTATLSVNVEKVNAGRYANLYYHNPNTGQLEFMNYGRIAEDGSVDLPFVHASDYAIVIADEPLNGSGEEPSTEEEPKQENPGTGENPGSTDSGKQNTENNNTAGGDTTDTTGASNTGNTTDDNGTAALSPKTGDPYDLVAWYLLLLVMLGGVTALTLSKKKEEAGKSEKSS